MNNGNLIIVQFSVGRFLIGPITYFCCLKWVVLFKTVHEFPAFRKGVFDCFKPLIFFHCRVVSECLK
ncbi:hypothetical protein RJT34_24448 [Clitoria ternatea]|uniref:Uncharacterized protein n=1 Tax=Clitoria ternatea TaxID=43366 RepID=A0AAN9IHI1_CLITE